VPGHDADLRAIANQRIGQTGASLQQVLAVIQDEQHLSNRKMPATSKMPAMTAA
jgi:hypothetical protein